MKTNKNKIIDYQWQGLNRYGEKLEGLMVAPNLATVKIELRKQGIIAQKITRQPNALFRKVNKRITSNDIALFSRQMATMIKAGLSLTQSFDILINDHSNPGMKTLIQCIKKEVEAGLTLAESFHKYPKFFNPLFCNLIDAGEKSGSLEIMLAQIAAYKDKMATIKKKIRKILTYPTAVLTITLIVTIALLILVIPQFALLFKTFGAELPLLTRGVIYLSRFVQTYWLILVGSVVGAIYSVVYALKHSQQCRQLIDKLLLKMPILGIILTKTIVARFARTLAITFTAGLPLLEALKSVADVTGNFTYINAVNNIHQEIINGQSLQTALANTTLFPAMVIQMIAVGEESGTLDQMLMKIADYYEEEVDAAITTLDSLLEPIIMSLLGLLVGGLVIAMYLPIFKLGSIV